MNDPESILNYYKEELKWNSPFAEILSKYSPDALNGYLGMRQSIQEGHYWWKNSNGLSQYFILSKK